MTTTTKFQVRNCHGAIETHDTLSAAVLAAAQEDGYGSVYQRDDDGVMRLYSSRKHIGNNNYFPKDDEAFQAESILADDDAAENDVAEQILKRGVFHSKHELDIAKLTFENGILTHVDGKTVEDMLADIGDDDDTVELIRSMYV